MCTISTDGGCIPENMFFKCAGETDSYLINFTATEGHDVRMRCPGQVKNRWWKGYSDRILVNGHVQPDFHGHVSFDDKTGFLTIHNVNVNDSSVYLCGGLDALHEVHLTVLGKF